MIQNREGVLIESFRCAVSCGRGRRFNDEEVCSCYPECMISPSVKKNALMVKKTEMGGWCGWRSGKGVGVSGLGMKRVGEMSFEHRRCYWRKS